MDLDDLDGPGQVPARRPSRFLPKSSKPKPEPKPETVSKPEPVSKSEPEEVDDALVSSKREEDTKPVIAEMVHDAATSTANGTAKMEVEAKADIKEPPKEDSMKVDEEEGDDQVVREIDVFFTPPSFGNNTQIYVLQYPLRSSWRPYELDDRCQEVRVKPKSAEVEVDLAVDVDSKNYDADCGNGVKMTKQGNMISLFLDSL